MRRSSTRKLGFCGKLVVGGLASLAGFGSNASCSTDDIFLDCLGLNILAEQQRQIDELRGEEDFTAPLANFTVFPSVGRAPLQVLGASTSSDPESGISEYSWDFDGDGVEDSNASVANFTYENPGVFRPRLVVTNAVGLSSTSEGLEVTVNKALSRYVTGSAWTHLASLSFRRNNLGAAVGNDNCVYVVGGEEADYEGNWLGQTNLVEKYNPESHTLEIIPLRLNIARSHLGVVADDDGRIYAIGGLGSNQEILSSVERYDPANPEDGWQFVLELQEPRYLCKAVNSQGKIHVIGGASRYEDETSWFRGVKVYDPETDSWDNAGDLNLARTHFGAAVDDEGRIYAFGGDVIDPNRNLTDTTERYDSANPEEGWNFVAPMQMAQRVGAGVSGSDGHIFAVGGRKSMDIGLGGSKEVYVYRPEEDSWEFHSALMQQRTNSASARDSKNRIYMLGGTDVLGTSAVDIVERTVLTER